MSGLGFVLRGINPKVIRENMYGRGGIIYGNLPRTKIKSNNVQMLSVDEFPKKEFIRSIKDRNGSVRNILVNKINENAPCYWCRIGRESFPSSPFLRPIGLHENGDKIIIIGVDNYCSIECCYADVLDRLPKKGKDHILLQKSETILHNIYSRIGGRDRLVPSKDWKLLESNGGVLDEKRYRAKKITMEPSNNMQFARCYLEYYVYTK